MSGPPPDETAEFFGEMRKLEARAKERGSGLTPDREALAARIFGEETAPDFGESLERLTVALVALRTAFVPDPPSVGRLGREVFLQALERIAEAAGPTPHPLRVLGDISEKAPTLLENPLFWREMRSLREDALLGDERSYQLLEANLDRLRVPKRRYVAARSGVGASQGGAARELLRDPEFMAGPLAKLAVSITRGKRGRVPLRAAALLLADPKRLARLRHLENEREKTREPERQEELQRESEALREKLRRHALTLEYRRDEAARAEREREKSRREK